MTRFFGEIGYAETAVESPPDSGNFIENIIERNLYGDVITNSRRFEDSSETVNGDISVGNSISVVADAYAREHFHAIRYVKWSGVRWVVTNVTVLSPRLLLQLGEVYNGKLPS